MGRRTRLYMAYGSNMNLEQMADRCRTAEVVGKGILKNYELLFRGARHGAVATVEPREGSSVPVVLWEIGARDEVARSAAAARWLSCPTTAARLSARSTPCWTPARPWA